MSTKIDADYLVPAQYTHEEVNVTLKMSIYRFTNGYWEHKETLTIDGVIISGSFKYELNSDIRSTCNLQIQIKNDNWQAHSDGYVWYNKIYKMQLVYKYQDDTTDTIDMGYFLPNSSSFEYNETTKVLSLSCTDPISLLMDSRSGALTTYFDWAHPIPNYNTLVLQGDNSNYMASMDNGNYIATLQHYRDDRYRSTMWKEIIDNTDTGHIEELPPSPAPYRQDPPNPIAQTIQSILYDYSVPLDIYEYSVSLQNDYQPLPFDLEFDPTCSMYDVFKKIIDLYPNQYLFYDTQLRLHFEQLPISWILNNANLGSYANTELYYGREFTNLVLNENVSYNFENTYNEILVFGRDYSCSSFYQCGWEFHCDNCGWIGDYYYAQEYDSVNKTYHWKCPQCGTYQSYLQADGSETNFVTIGDHKYVETCNDCLTDEECHARAKWLSMQKNQVNNQLTIKLADRVFPMLKSRTLGIGSRVEYTSFTTGETNAYVCVGLSYNVNPPESYWEMTLTPFVPLKDDNLPLGNTSVVLTHLPIPDITASVDENGLVTINISSSMEDYCLYKVYVSNYSYTALRKFIGETCTNTFQYQLTENGSFYFYVQAYNPELPPSSGWKEACGVTYNGFNNYLTTETGEIILDSEGGNKIKI